MRGSIGAFPVGPGGGDETCFPDLAVPSLTDSTPPRPRPGSGHLSRGRNACGVGSYGLQHDEFEGDDDLSLGRFPVAGRMLCHQ